MPSTNSCLPCWKLGQDNLSSFHSARMKQVEVSDFPASALAIWEACLEGGVHL